MSDREQQRSKADELSLRLYQKEIADIDHQIEALQSKIAAFHSERQRYANIIKAITGKAPPSGLGNSKEPRWDRRAIRRIEAHLEARGNKDSLENVKRAIRQEGYTDAQIMNSINSAQPSGKVSLSPDGIVRRLKTARGKPIMSA